MGDMVKFVGGIAVVMGAFDFLFTTPNVQTAAIKVVGGLVLCGVGLLMEKYKV